MLDGDTKQATAISALVPATLRASQASLSTTRIAESRILALDIDPSTQQPRGHGNVNADGTPRSKL